MKDKFLLSDPGPNDKPVHPVRAAIIVVVFAVLLGLVLCGGLQLFFQPSVMAPSLMWLSNPFNTTKKLKVDYRNRKGHRERSYVSMVVTLVRIVIWATLLAWIASNWGK